jgi:hypothetical protein
MDHLAHAARDLGRRRAEADAVTARLRLSPGAWALLVEMANARALAGDARATSSTVVEDLVRRAARPGVLAL